MATINATVKEIVSRGSAKHVTWPNLANGDDGQAVEHGDFPDRSVQVEGTFGTGGEIQIQGSNDGTNFHTLTDPQGNALTFNAAGGAGIEAISEVTQYIKPDVTGGDGTTDLTVTIFMRGDF